MASTTSTAENFRSAGQEAGATAENLVGRTRERVGNAYRKVKERGIDTEEAFEGYVSDHPLGSVLIALGVGAGLGILAGTLIGRRF